MSNPLDPAPRPPRPAAKKRPRYDAPHHQVQRAVLLTLVAGARVRDDHTLQELRRRRVCPFRATPRVVAAALRLGAAPDAAAAMLAAAQPAVVAALSAGVTLAAPLGRAA